MSSLAHAESLGELISSKRATVGIVGLGYVGIPLSHVFLKSGYSVLGYDVVESRVDALNRGEAVIASLEDKIADLSAGKFKATCNPDDLSKADAICICVPTPVDSHQNPDLSYVLKSAAAISKILRPGQLICLESTTFPGTTSELLREVLDKSGLEFGKEYFLAYSPERENPGGSVDTKVIPKLVGGCDQISGDLAYSLYTGSFAKTHRVSSAEVGEAAKLVENIYRAVNIALVNELKIIFSKMDINIWEVLDAAGTKPFGFQRFNPGPGWGGHCIPVDPFYLSYKAREYGTRSFFIEHAGSINDEMPRFVVSVTQSALNTKRKAFTGSKILIIGIAYKPNVDDCRETPAFPIMKLLKDYGAEVAFYDPYVGTIPRTRKWHMLAGMKSEADLSPEVLSSFDAVMLHTRHSSIDLETLLKSIPEDCVVVDTAGKLDGPRVFKA